MPLDIPLPSDDPSVDPAQYVPLLLSAVEGFLQLREVWAEADYPQAYRYMEQLKVYIVECFGKCNDVQAFSNKIVMSGWEMSLVVGTALNKTANGVYMFAGYAEVSPAQQDSAMDTYFLAQAGVHNYEIWGFQSTNQGIVTIFLDGQPQAATLDWYGATTNNFKKTGSLTIVGDGLHHIQFSVGSKNAASSGYGFRFAGMVLTH